MMRKNNKGFTLVETILAVGIIALATIGIYNAANKKHDNYLASKQAQYIEQISTSIKDYLVTVSDTNIVTAPGNITTFISPTNLIAANIIPREMVTSATQVTSLFGGTVGFSGTTLAVSATRTVPGYEITLNNVPGAICSQLAGDSRLATLQRITVNGFVVKQPGTATLDVADLAARCAFGSNIVRFANEAFKEGIDPTTSSGAVARLRNKEAAWFIAPSGTNVAYGFGAGMCTGGASWNPTNSVCQCAAGFSWNGSSCQSYGAVGVCPLGMGWNMATKLCQVLATGTGGPVGQNYVAGRAVPANITTPAQVATASLACIGGATPAGATAPSNAGGNFDGKVCNMCINGSWNGARCVTP